MKKAKKHVISFKVVIVILALAFVGAYIAEKQGWVEEDTVKTEQNYNDNSSFHQILAKNYLVKYLKKNLKDDKSYEEVSYKSNYNASKGCYEVLLTYRAKNSFGATVLEQVSGDVYFTNNSVSIQNFKSE